MQSRTVRDPVSRFVNPKLKSHFHFTLHTLNILTKAKSTVERIQDFLLKCNSNSFCLAVHSSGCKWDQRLAAVYSKISTCLYYRFYVAATSLIGYLRLVDHLLHPLALCRGTYTPPLLQLHWCPYSVAEPFARTEAFVFLRSKANSTTPDEKANVSHTHTHTTWL